MSTFANIFNETVQEYTGWQAALADNPLLKTAQELLIKLQEIDPKSENLIVGGAVRDLLLGHKPHDIDIATSIDIDVIEKYFKVDEIGKSKDFGILNVHFQDETFEIAHFRVDSKEYSDARRPDSVNQIKTFAGDATRRDISINALGIDSKGYIHDYVGGIDDLNQKLIRAVGEPFKRFSEDTLRILRTLRFSIKLGFKIHPKTEQAIVELKHNIKNVAPDRIRDEIFKVAGISGEALANYIEYLDKVGLLEIILPELHNLKYGDFPHNPEYHPEGDVFRHILSALIHSKSKDPISNIGIMTHDLGKANSKALNDKGGISYKGHEKTGVEIFEKIANRLKFSNDQRDSVLFAIEYHMQGHNFPDLKKSTVMSLRQDKNWPILKDVIYADQASRGPTFDKASYDKDMDYVENVFKTFGEKQAFEKRMAQFVDGRMIMSLVDGIKGKDIGIIKNAIREKIVETDFNISKEEVIEYIGKLAKELGYADAENSGKRT